MSHFPTHSTRRDWLFRAGGAIGGMALGHLMGSELRASGASGVSRGRPHFAPKAKRVIYLFMHGGPSHMDLWDPKPDLVRYAGQPLPDSFGSVMTRRKVAKNPLLPPARKFRPGASAILEAGGLWNAVSAAQGALACPI